MALLRITCKSCHTSFVSAHQGQSPRSGRLERCPHCGAAHRYGIGEHSYGGMVGPLRRVEAKATETAALDTEPEWIAQARG